MRTVADRISKSLKHRLTVLFDRWLSSFSRSFNLWPGQRMIAIRPNFHRKQRQIDNFDDIMTVWNAYEKNENFQDVTRLYFILLQFRYLQSKVPDGAMAELGVYKGLTAKLFRLLAPNRSLYLFDTFEGFNEKDIKSEVQQTGLRKLEGRFSDTSLSAVKAFVGNAANVHFIKGWFPDSMRGLEIPDTFAFVHLDADLYEPTKAGLEFFYPKLVPGGVLIAHDYNNSYVGSRRAIDEFFVDKPETPVQVPDEAGSVVIIKSKSASK